MNSTDGVVVDSAGNIFISDYGNGEVRMVNASGTITTVVGDGNYGYIGDGGSATAARIGGSVGLAIDRSGNLFIADTNNNVLRKVALIAAPSEQSIVGATVDPSLTFTVAGRSSVCNGQSATNFQTTATATVVIR